MPLTLTPVTPGSLTVTAVTAGSVDNLYPSESLYPSETLCPRDNDGFVAITPGVLVFT